MTQPFPLLKFSPSAQDPKILTALTVQRDALLDELADVALQEGSGLGHHLLVGPRGIGKSHVLTLLTQRVRASDAHPERMVVAWLVEDPWAVRSYTKLLVAVLAAIGDDLRDEQVIQAATALRSRSDSAAPQAVEEELRGVVGDRRVVVVVENLDEIFRRIGNDGQSRLRALAENWQQMLILGSTPQLFAGVSRHSSPFYGFFRVTHLEELTLDSATELLRRVARLRGDDRLLAYLDTEVARRRLLAVSALAGGHPRIWLLFAGCLSIAAIDELVPLFLEALDDLTPYYQDRLRSLGDQQQELVVLLCESGGALSNRALADRSGLAPNQVAAALKQLADRGYVRRAQIPESLDQGDGRASFWELREPLMRLCLDVKQARGEPLRIVVDFLRAWYGVRILDELEQIPDTAELATSYAREAFRALDGYAPDDLLAGTPREVVARADAGLGLQPGDRTLVAAKAAALLQQGLASDARRALPKLDDDSELPVLVLLMSQNIALLQELSGEAADWQSLAGFGEDLQQALPERTDVLETLGYALEKLGQLDQALAALEFAVSAGSATALCARARVLIQLNREVDALHELERAAALMPHDSAVWRTKGDALARLGRPDDASSAYAQALEKAVGHDERALALGELGRHTEALAEWEEAAALGPTTPAVHIHRGVALTHLGRLPEALEAFTWASELAPGRADFHAIRARTALALGRAEVAAESYRAALLRDPDNARRHDQLGVALRQLGHTDDAEAAHGRASELEPERAEFHLHHADALRGLGQFDAAESAVSRAIELDRTDPAIRFAATAIALDRGDARQAIGRLRVALDCWREAGDRGAPGDTALLCEITWTKYRHDPGRDRLLRELLTAYDNAGVLAELGSGLVRCVPRFLDPDVSHSEAANWVATWEEQARGFPFSVPLAILAAARDWKGDGDRAHLLALPPEQRDVLLPLIEPFAGSAD